MNLLTDSFSVLINHAGLVMGILLFLFAGQIIVWAALQMIFRGNLSADEYYSLSLAGWMLPVLLSGLLWLSARYFKFQVIGTLTLSILLALAIMILVFRNRKDRFPDSKIILFLLMTLFGIIAFLRLAFVSKAVIPQYFDSAQHYFIIKNIVGNFATSSAFPWLPSVYYHIGFHIVAAWITAVFQADIISLMLILGQVILAVIPLSVFFLVRHETQSRTAGLFAVLLAAFGWYMPAHAVDWGKYPALTSLALINFVVSLAYLLVRDRKALSPGRLLGLLAILVLGMTVSIFTHSRSLVIFGLIFLAWVVATGWQRLPPPSQWIFLGLVIAGITAELLFIRTQDVFGPLFDPYVNKGLGITLIVLLFALFAQFSFPRLTLSILLFMFLLLGSLFIPVKGIPGYIDLTLLDRPFIEMILYMPLSLLGGLGLAGLERQLYRWQSNLENTRFSWNKSVPVFFIAIVLINAMFKYEVYPSGCCNIVSPDDLVAMDWVAKNLPGEARILIASTELRVLATDEFQGSAGGDAGIWITPLTGRATIPLPYISDFSQPATLETLCNQQAQYIYVGETGLTFNDSQIAPHSDWYKTLLAMPKVKVYQVIGCH